MSDEKKFVADAASEIQSLLASGATPRGLSWSSTPILTNSGVIYLHVRIDTRTIGFYHKFWARAWTSTSDSSDWNVGRVSVGRIKLSVQGQIHQEQECEQCDYREINEQGTGGLPDTLWATAWCWGPNIGPVTVKH